MTEIDLTDSRAEQVQPQGFVPSPLAVPMLRDRDARARTLEYTASTLGEVRVAADILASPVEDGEDPALRMRLAEFVSTEATRLQRLVKALAVGALAALVLTVGLVAGPTAGRAEAAEVPQPDPTGSVATAPVYPVVMDRFIKAVPVPVVSTTRGPSGLFCASVVRLGQPLGRSCSSVPWFTVTAWLDARVTPLGRVVAYVRDDATGASVPIVLDLRRPSKFGAGTWLDLGEGDEFVSAPVYAYTASKGAWTPQQLSPVVVQELTRRGWRTRATLTTTTAGVVSGTVHLGGGVHVVRVVRPAGLTVWAATGATRTVVVTTEPLDII